MFPRPYWTEKRKPKFSLGDFVRTADKNTVFSKGYTTNWSHRCPTITKKIYHTIPFNHTNNLLERYKEALLRKTEKTSKENKKVIRKKNYI